jgi:hypothetical protein
MKPCLSACFAALIDIKFMIGYRKIKRFAMKFGQFGITASVLALSVSAHAADIQVPALVQDMAGCFSVR